MVDLPNLKFPCHYPVKVIGYATDEFEENAMQIIRKHTGEFPDNCISRKWSQNFKYLSITIHFIAESRRQVDDLYGDLADSEHVLIML